MFLSEFSSLPYKKEPKITEFLKNFTGKIFYHKGHFDDMMQDATR